MNKNKKEKKKEKKGKETFHMSSIRRAQVGGEAESIIAEFL